MNEHHTLLYQLKITCRWALGLVWIWEGLVPKMLMPTTMQTRVVENSGLYWPDPASWLIILGIGMIAMGLLLCSGFLERLTVLTASVTMSILIVLVISNNFYDSVGDMHGGLAKDACLYACAWVVWKLAPHVPHKATK
ncbi:MAG: DoxX-like family protein [Verrucomicrobiales bacterium]|nr:DoxX-like family protein [Verrucomicrobiales bacterium]